MEDFFFLRQRLFLCLPRPPLHARQLSRHEYLRGRWASCFCPCSGVRGVCSQERSGSPPSRKKRPRPSPPTAFIPAAHPPLHHLTDKGLVGSTFWTSINNTLQPHLHREPFPNHQRHRTRARRRLRSGLELYLRGNHLIRTRASTQHHHKNFLEDARVCSSELRHVASTQIEGEVGWAGNVD